MKLVHVQKRESSSVTVHHGDALDVLRDMPDASAHAIVTDPPYGLSNTTPTQVTETMARWAAGDRGYVPSGRGFMGKEWDAFVPPPALWDEVVRVLKPGGHVLCFAGARTADLMSLSLRMAGLDIRDTVMWVYGSGMPKSHNISKAIDKAAGAEREVVGYDGSRARPNKENFGKRNDRQPTAAAAAGWKDNGATITAPATDAAQEWDGWGTALKPAHEPVIMARKPLEGTVAENVQVHRTGALHIDACRIPHRDAADLAESTNKNRHASFGSTPGRNKVYGDYTMVPSKDYDGAAGRWPANLILDEHTAALMDDQSGSSTSRKGKPRTSAAPGDGWGMTATGAEYNDTGGASRFFYVVKPGKKERPVVDGVRHPTQKPVDLMRHLIRLVSAPGALIVDPFAGSGTTAEAAILEGVDVVAIEREAEYIPLIEYRVARARKVQAAPPAPQTESLF